MSAIWYLLGGLVLLLVIIYFIREVNNEAKKFGLSTEK